MSEIAPQLRNLPQFQPYLALMQQIEYAHGGPETPRVRSNSELAEEIAGLFANKKAVFMGLNENEWVFKALEQNNHAMFGYTTESLKSLPLYTHSDLRELALSQEEGVEAKALADQRLQQAFENSFNHIASYMDVKNMTKNKLDVIVEGHMPNEYIPGKGIAGNLATQNTQSFHQKASAENAAIYDSLYGPYAIKPAA